MSAKIFRRGALFLLTMILVAAIVSAWVASTESGLRFALRQAEPLMVVDAVSGRLSDARLEGVEVNLQGTRINIDELTLAWRPIKLLSRNFHIDTFSMQNVEVLVENAAENNNTEPWAGFELPINIVLQYFEVQTLRISSAGGGPVLIEKLVGGIDVIDNQLNLRSLKMKSDIAALALDGSLGLEAKADDDVNLRLVAEIILDEHGMSVDINGNLQGTWGEMQLSSSLVATPIELAGTTQDVVLQATQKQLAELTINGVVSQVLSPRPEVNLNGSWAIPLDLLSMNSPPTSFVKQELSSVGTLEFSGMPNDYRFNANGTTNDKSRSLLNVKLAGRGSLNEASLDQLQIATFQERGSPVSNFTGNAEADWSQDFRWLVDGVLTDFSPRLLFGEGLKDLDHLSGQIHSQGQFKAGVDNSLGAVGALSAKSLTATWQGFPISANLELNLLEKNIQLQELSIKGSSLAISAKGFLGDESDLGWSIDASKLNTVSKDFEGVLKGNGRLLGALASPTIQFDVDGEGIKYQPTETDVEASWSLASLLANGEITQLGQDSPLNIFIALEQLEQGDQRIIEAVEVDLSGTDQQHRLKVSSTLPNQTIFSTSLEGSYQKYSGQAQEGLGTWSAVISDLSLDSEHFTPWRLRESAKLKVDQKQIDLDQVCIVSRSQSLCAKSDVSFTNARQNMSLDLTAFDLSVLEPLLSLQDIKLQGTVDGKLDYLALGADKAPTLEAELTGTSVRLGLPESSPAQGVDKLAMADLIEAKNTQLVAPLSTDENGREWLQFEQANLSILQTDSLQAKASFKLDQDHFMVARLSSKQTMQAGSFHETPVQGVLELEWADLSMLPSEFIGGTQISGRLATRLEMDGTFSDPKVSMRSELSNANLFLPATGVTYSNISATAVSRSESKIDVTGRLMAGEGELIFSGDMDFSKPKSPQAKLKIKGNNLNLLHSSDIDALGSLDLLLSYEDQISSLIGDIVVERADLQLGARENVILASDDVVMQGSEESTVQSKQRLRLNIDLGSATSLNAAGLSANLNGQVGISQEPGELMIGQGKIDVVNGVYKAYGEVLSISKGQLIFNGSSVDDPRLDLEATRDLSNVVAGVKVQGSAQSPRISLFSKPSMSDQDVLSMLIFGKKLASLGGEDSLTLLRIAASLRGKGPDRFSRMTNQLQNALGLSELELSLADDSPEIVAGKQLTSRFYVGYGYGLLDAAQSLVLRFKINDAWSLQGDFGANNGADLRYQVER